YSKDAFNKRNDLVLMEEFINRDSQVRVGTESTADVYLKAPLVIANLRNKTYVVNKSERRIIFAGTERYLELATHVLANRIAQEVLEGLVSIRRHIEWLLGIYTRSCRSRHVAHGVTASFANGHTILLKF